MVIFLGGSVSGVSTEVDVLIHNHPMTVLKYSLFLLIGALI